MSDADDRNRSDSVDPSDFVQRIRELGEQRDQEDAERFRQLEDEIKQGRSERLARRAGRLASRSHVISVPCYPLIQGKPYYRVLRSRIQSHQAAAVPLLRLELVLARLVLLLSTHLTRRFEFQLTRPSSLHRTTKIHQPSKAF